MLSPSFDTRESMTLSSGLPQSGHFMGGPWFLSVLCALRVLRGE
jgi:hypothetical protein